MKNRIANDSKPKLEKITIELPPEAHAGLQEMADYLGATMGQVIEALVVDQPKDYLGRQNDGIWEHLIDYLQERHGETPRFKIVGAI